jgi:RNA polymerase sigma factor (sigma-70 family)
MITTAFVVSLASVTLYRSAPCRSRDDRRQEASNLASDDEPQTLAALYLRNREVMLRAARAILRNPHDAEDAVSAAVVRVATRLAAGHPIGDPDSYLIQSVRNAAIDHVRASGRRRAQQANDVIGGRAQPSSGSPRALEDIADATPDIAEQILDRQRSADVQAAVRRTTEGLAEREAAMLSLLLAGHTRVEIGTRFDLTGQRVGQLLKKPVADLLREIGVDPATGRPRPDGGRRTMNTDRRPTPPAQSTDSSQHFMTSSKARHHDE